MELIERNTPIGNLYIHPKNEKMALERNGELLTDADEIFQIFNENRIPLRVEFEITEKCNFNCYYCFAESLKNRKDLSTTEIKAIIDKLEEIGIVFIDITGGEPLARTDFLDILKYINSKNFIVKLITNGSFLNQEIIDELEKGNVTQIRLSLLAPTEESCDKLTGVKGSFKKTTSAAKLLSKSNLNFYISSVITKANVHMFNEYEALEKKLGKKIAFELGVGPTFNGYDDIAEYCLGYDDMDYIKEFTKTRIYKNEREKTCDAGKNKFCINNQGKLLPCMKIRKPVGDLLKESFYDIWNSDYMNEIIGTKLKPNEKCLKCDKKDYCASFCPALSSLKDTQNIKCKSADIIHKLLFV